MASLLQHHRLVAEHAPTGQSVWMSHPSDLRQLLMAMLNMTAFHREHEKFYSVSPREQAVNPQRHSRTLHALADRWMTVAPDSAKSFSPTRGPKI